MSTSGPHVGTLDRERAQEVAQNFSNSLDSLRTIVDYSTNLMIRSYETSDKDLVALVVLLALYKQLIAQTDAAEELLRRCIVQPAMLQARSQLEILMYLKWMIKEETEPRSVAYFVSALRKERLSALREIPGTQEHEAFEHFRETVGSPRPGEVKRQREARRLVDSISRSLTCGRFSAVDEVFSRFYEKRNRELEWPRALDEKWSVWRIATDVGMRTEYETLYSWGSGVSHGSTLTHVVSLDSGTVSAYPLRAAESFSTLLRTVMVHALNAIKEVMEAYRPGELETYSRKYVEEWGQPLKKIPDIQVTYT